MAEEGQNENDINITSEEFKMDLVCQPCENDGEHRAAVGFCINCREYLCKRCYDVHLIPTVTKKHALLDKDHMTDSECKHSCQWHTDREIKYHCPLHAFFGCQLCFLQHHNSCKDIICIPDVFTATASLDEFDNVNKKIENVSNKCNKLHKEIKHNLDAVSTNHAVTTAAIRDFKQDILEVNNKLEKELVDRVDMVKREDTDKLMNISQRVTTLLKDTQKMSARIERLKEKEQTSDLYVELIQSKDKILKQEDEIQTIEFEKQIRQFLFQANRELIEMIKSPIGIGSLGLKMTIEKVRYVRDINCKSLNDASSCIITGMTLLADQKLIVSDWNSNNTVKLIDMRQGKIVSDLKLSSNSFGICKIKEDMVAVTLPDERKVVLLRSAPTLCVERELVVNGKPNGIDYLDGKLVVSYNGPNKVEIMDMQGTVITTVEKDKEGQSLFNMPSYLAVNPRNKLIYISNLKGHTVICMKVDGTVVATYKDNDLARPRQIIFDSSGKVFVCGEGSHNVHQITEDCKKVKVVLTSADGLSSPQSICYQESEELFNIGQYKMNEIKVYSVTYAKL